MTPILVCRECLPGALFEGVLKFPRCLHDIYQLETLCEWEESLQEQT